MSEALFEHALNVRVEVCSDAAEMIARATATPPTLIITSFDIDECVGIETLAAIGQAIGIRYPRAVVCFDDPAHPGRTTVAEAGVIDFVLSRGTVDRPLLALIERLITRDVLETRLASTTRQFRTIVENTNDGMYILQNGEFAYANPKFQRMVEFSLDELLAPGFDVDEKIIAPQSRELVQRRVQRIDEGLPVAPRYDFVALRKDKTEFDAQVSISYIEYRGAPATLGVIQDITDRKRFEREIVRKNREFALVNEMADAINAARSLDEILRTGCQRLHDLLRVAAVGVTLLDQTRSELFLRASVGLGDKLKARLQSVALQNHTLLADAVRRGLPQHVEDIRNDARVQIPEVKNAGFAQALVVPLKANDRVVGGLFVFADEGRAMDIADIQILQSIGVLLGTASEKASLLELEKAAVARMRAVDEIAQAVSARLEMLEVAETVAASLARLFGAQHVIIAQHDAERKLLVPLATLDGINSASRAPLLVRGSLYERALLRGEPQQHFAIDVSVRNPAPSHIAPLYLGGIQKVVVAPVTSDGTLSGGILLGFADGTPLSDDDISTLAGLATHVAIAMKNAQLFAARNQALLDLQSAQNKLVQSEKLRALGELAAGVAHDFNNVLGAILGRAELLRKRLTNPALLKHAEIIEKAANDGAETVRRIQELGRQDNTDDFVPVDIVAILDDVAEFTRPRWKDKPLERGIQIDLYIEARASDIWSRGNPHEIREVLINLVHNASDAMPEGGKILLAVEKNVADATCIIRVRDTGTGITEAVRQKVFDPFFTTKGDKGTGLGLSVSYSILQRHSGDIEVESQTEGPNRGTEFILRLPLCPPPPPVEVVAPKNPEAEKPTSDDMHRPSEAVDSEKWGTDEWATGPSGESQRGRVLVVDDEENIRDILTDFLSSEGLDVITAEDGASALELLKAQRFDLVLTDLGLPGVDGYQVASQAKALAPDLPVCLVTGWGATLDMEKAKARGVDHLLSKPFKFEQLLDLVGDVMGDKS